VVTGPARREAWCVRITIHPTLKKIYWTQGSDNAGVGCVFRANIDIPKGGGRSRSDIELLFVSCRTHRPRARSGKPRPLLDRHGDPSAATPVNASDRQKSGARIVIRISWRNRRRARRSGQPDGRHRRRSVYSADLDGKNERNFLYAQGNLTGIAYAEV
jgi:hypothetical protein